MDVAIIETLNGGDISKLGNDVALALGFENMPYIAMFGGNPQQSTPSIRIGGEQNFDWFGNVFESDPVVQTNSSTERTLRNVALNSAGRVSIEQAVNTDLQFMKAFAIVNVSVSIISDDRVQIDIEIIEPTNKQNKNFRYIWDSTLQGLTIAENNYQLPLEGIGYWIIEDTFIVQ